MIIKMSFLGEPKAVQSMRVAQIGGFIRKYQPKQNIEWKNYIRIKAQQQLPEGFRILDAEARISVLFVFPAGKSWSKRNLEKLANGERFGKTTKPDLVDNLCKGLCDALTGTVWRDDAIITRVTSEKVFGAHPGIRLEVEGE